MSAKLHMCDKRVLSFESFNFIIKNQGSGKTKNCVYLALEKGMIQSLFKLNNNFILHQDNSQFNNL